MVGLDKIRTSNSSCSECNTDGITTCDKCGLYICREHSTLIPVLKNINEGLLQVMHLKCSSSSHRSKIEKIRKKYLPKEVKE